MAPNSLFAVLLRSRWWISFAVGGVWALVAAALVPAPYQLVGVLGALPFVALGVVAFFRQMGTLAPARQQALLDRAAAQSWVDFSNDLQRAWTAQGYQVQRSVHLQSTTMTESVDFQLVREGHTTLVLARRWKAAHHGIGPLRGLHQVGQLQHVHQCLYVCLNLPNEMARQFADAHCVVVLHGTDLAQLLHQAGHD